MSSLAAKKALPVLIIGSGLGGLTLAHALQKQRIPYLIFERDVAESQRAQGYRIRIEGEGAGGLKASLTPELFERFEKTCGDESGVGGRLDGPSGNTIQKGALGLIGTGGWRMYLKLLTRYLWMRRSVWGRKKISLLNGLPAPYIQPAEKDYKVDRRVLRSVLLTNQSDNITYESTLTSYTLHEDSVEAHFANGRSVRGSLLVGADGSRSNVSRQLVGDPAVPIELGTRIIYGKTPLTPHVESELQPILRSGTSFVTDATAEGDTVLLVLEAMRFDFAGSPDDYVFWALCAKKEVFERVAEDSSTAVGEPAARVAATLTAGWHPGIRVLLDRQAPDQTATLRMVASDPEGPAVWPTNRRVTVLGDAIHCMPPTGGQGANSALHDAALLGAILGNSGENCEGGWSTETIRMYEDAMRYNIGDIVALACIGLAGILRADLPSTRL